MRKLSKVSVLVTLAVALCLLVGLTSNVMAAPKKGKEEIIIGCHLPLSGGLASLGKERLWAYEAAVADVNAAGGIYVKEYDKKMPIKFICYDDETDPAKAAQVVERLIKREKVDFILGGEAGPYGVLPGAITAEKYKVLYHTTACVAEAWLEQNFKYSTLIWWNGDQGTEIAYPIFDELKAQGTPITKPALFLEDTYEGRVTDGQYRANAEKYGYKIEMTEFCIPGAKDYSAQILKAKAAGVDAIIMLATNTDCITILRQMKENDFNPKFYMGYRGTWSSEFYDAMGAKDAQYITTDAWWHEDLPYPGSKELGERYRKATGRFSTSLGGTYALSQVLFQAIENAGTLDTIAVRNQIVGHSFDTMNGPFTFDERGLAWMVLKGTQWQADGTQKLLYPKDLAGDNKPEVMVPWKER